MGRAGRDERDDSVVEASDGGSRDGSGNDRSDGLVAPRLAPGEVGIAEHSRNPGPRASGAGVRSCPGTHVAE